MPEPAHAQRTLPVTEEHRELVRRAADVCRARPAVFAAVVRHADELRRQGVERDEALRVALGVHC